MNLYEKHGYLDSDFPLIFHIDTLTQVAPFLPHWHENIELLFVRDGLCEISSNGTTAHAKPGDVIVFNSGILHDVKAITTTCTYCCLILDKNFCNDFELAIEHIEIQQVISSPQLSAVFERLVEEMREKKKGYKPLVKCLSIELLIQCFRHHQTNTNSSLYKPSKRQKKIQMVIEYLRSHFKEDISMDDLCEYTGFSKYYLCREFKELTEQTVVDYLNALRLEHARTLIQHGTYNVSESAYQSGFHNLSYFTRLYKRRYQVSPSKEFNQES